VIPFGFEPKTYCLEGSISVASFNN